MWKLTQIQQQHSGARQLESLLIFSTFNKLKLENKGAEVPIGLHIEQDHPLCQIFSTYCSKSTLHPPSCSRRLTYTHCINQLPCPRPAVGFGQWEGLAGDWQEAEGHGLGISSPNSLLAELQVVLLRLPVEWPFPTAGVLATAPGVLSPSGLVVPIIATPRNLSVPCGFP